MPSTPNSQTQAPLQNKQLPTNHTFPPSSAFSTSSPTIVSLQQLELSFEPSTPWLYTRAPPTHTSSGPSASDTPTVASPVASFSLNSAPLSPTTLLPSGQFGVGVKGGMQYVIHSTLAEVEKYIDIPEPLRALLALDVVNMFNEVSRDAIRAELAKIPKLAVLIPYFDLLYAEANTCWIRGHDSHYQTFLQDEGVAQGCPLSSAFSSLVQRRLMLSLNANLLCRQRNANQLQTIPKSYMDNTTPILDYADILWYLTEFQRRGLPLGIQLNFIKTKILSSITGLAPNLSPANRAHLQAALQYLQDHGNTSPELLDGIRILGFPVGNAAFAEQYLSNAARQFQHNTSLLSRRLHDSRTQSTLFCACTQAWVTHLLPADIYYRSTPTHTPANKQWSSPFLDQIHTTTLRFIRGLTNQTDDLPLVSKLLAFYPASLGGAGYCDHADASVDHFVTSLARSSIQYSTNGIPLPDKTVLPIPIALRRSMMDWARPTSTSRLFQLLQSLAPLVLPNTSTTSVTFATLHTKLPGLSRFNYQTSQRQRMLHFLRTAPPGFATAIPSLLTPMTSLPLHSLPRHHPANHLPAPAFRTLLQRKLRLPLLPPRLLNQKCSCGKPINKFGNHFFSCRSSSKTIISNAIRDTLCVVLRKIAPLTGLCNLEHDVTIEPPNWLPNYPHLRPADVGIHLSSPPSPNCPTPIDRIAIDVTVSQTPDFSHDPLDLSASSLIAQRAHKAHHDAARKSLRHATTTPSSSMTLIKLASCSSPLPSISSAKSATFSTDSCSLTTQSFHIPMVHLGWSQQTSPTTQLSTPSSILSTSLHCY